MSKTNIEISSIQTSALNSVSKEYMLAKHDLLTLMNTGGYAIDEENGKIFVKKNGETIRDEKTQDPLPFDVVMDEFAKEKGLVKPDAAPPAPTPTGRGGKSTTKPPAVFTTYKEMAAAFEAQGKSTYGHEFMTKAMEYSKDNPDFFN